MNSEKTALAVSPSPKPIIPEFPATPILNDKELFMQVLRLMALPIIRASLYRLAYWLRSGKRYLLWKAK